MVQALSPLASQPTHPWVDSSTGPLDDAAVVRAPSGGPGLVMTIDVVTPMVDDPRTFGAIAAANAISDVYAMGGVPHVALSFVGFPSGELPLEVLGEIVAGLGEVAREAGCAIVGGHTIIDPEPKAGLAVTGTVDPALAWTHTRARAGQALVLTKAIGTGVVVQAMKKEVAPPEVMAAAIASMRALSARARELGAAHGATAATDVTGFGLLGHLGNLAAGSGVRARVQADAVPLLPGVRALCEAGLVPGGTRKNLAWMEPRTRFAAGVDPLLRLLLADAQTSGGLLLAVPAERAEALARALGDEGMAGAVIGALEPAGADGVAIDVA